MSEGILLRELLLIRHGESKANIEQADENDCAGQADSVLSERGIYQAAKLAEYLRDENPDAVFSSGLRRAVQTGAAVSALREDRKLYILPGACEINMPAGYPGQTMQGLKALCPGADISLAPDVDPAAPLCVPDPTPDENEERYFERAKEVVDYFAAHFSSGEKVALVSHAGFLTYIIFYLLGFRHVQPRQDFRLSNTGITRILFFEPGTNRYGDVIFDCVNERRHLDCGYTT